MVLRLIDVDVLDAFTVLASKPSWAQDQMFAGRKNVKYFMPNASGCSKDLWLSEGL